MSVKYRFFKLLPYTSLAIIVFLYMLPRILSAQFGLLDDGVSLIIGKKFAEDPLTPFTFMRFSGRFFPVFWLYQSMVFQIAKYAAYRWYIANAFLLFVLSILLYKVTFKFTRNTWSAWLASALFILSGPVVESFYTITKSEPIMLLFASSACFVPFLVEKPIGAFKKSLIFLVVPLLFFCAYASKETALVMAGVCAGWLALTYILKKGKPAWREIRPFLWLFVASIVAVGIYFVVRQAFQTTSMTEGGYTTSYKLEFTAIMNQLLRWLGRFIRDDLYILPLALLLILPAVRRNTNLKLISYVCVWLAGWFVILLPWRVIESYYTLPFSFGISMLGGIFAGALLSSLPAISHWLNRSFIWIIGCLTLGLLTISVINNISNARLQLAYDRVNSRMVESLASLPENAKVLFNVPEPLEYVTEIKMHLAILYHRDDISVGYFSYTPQFTTDNVTTYVVSPVFRNQILPSVRNSLHEGGAIMWGDCLEANLTGLPEAELIENPNDEVLVFDIGLNRLLPSVGIGDPLTYGKRPWIDSKRTAYGWKVYHLPDRAYSYTSPGYFSNGIWTLENAEGDSYQVHFGQNGDLPLTGDWDGNGLTDLALFRNENLWLLDIDRDGNPDFEFKMVKPTPKSMPVVGDWDGNGIDSPGWYAPEEQAWYLFNAFGDLKPNWPLINFGVDDSIPLIGDWDGDGRDTPGVVQPSSNEFRYIDELRVYPEVIHSLLLPEGNEWLPAKWFDNKIDTLAVIDHQDWMFLPSNQYCSPPMPLPQLTMDDFAGIALAGVWKDQYSK